MYRERVPVEVTAWTAPGEPVPFAEAVRQEFTPFAVGSTWGRPWGTVWFHVTGTVPDDWDEPELLVDLGFGGASPGFQAEGLVYAADGTVDRKSTRLNSSHANISYAVFCLKKKNSLF